MNIIQCLEMTFPYTKDKCINIQKYCINIQKKNTMTIFSNNHSIYIKIT